MSKSNSASAKLVIISAPSGAGKTTLCQRLLAEFPKQLTYSKSTTTRKPRDGEVNGREYDFVSVEEFQKLKASNAFAEWAEVHGHFYGTSKQTLENAFQRGLSVVLDVDVQGAESLRNVYPARNLSIFIAPPNMEELVKRLRSRGTDSTDIIDKRVNNAASEMARSKDFHHIVVNDNLEHAYQKLKEILLKEVLRGKS